MKPMPAIGSRFHVRLFILLIFISIQAKSFSGADRFVEDYPCLTDDGAQLITRNKIQCVGIDSPSIESYNCDGGVHRELLGHDCCIIELLDLSAVNGGDYEMVALPLRLKGLDGSPARVVLYTQEK